MSTAIKEVLGGGVGCLENAADRESFKAGVMEVARNRGVSIRPEEVEALIDSAFDPDFALSDEELEVVASGCTCAFCTCSYMVATM